MFKRYDKVDLRVTECIGEHGFTGKNQGISPGLTNTVETGFMVRTIMFRKPRFYG